MSSQPAQLVPQILLGLAQSPAPSFKAVALKKAAFSLGRELTSLWSFSRVLPLGAFSCSICRSCCRHSLFIVGWEMCRWGNSSSSWGRRSFSLTVTMREGGGAGRDVSSKDWMRSAAAIQEASTLLGNRHQCFARRRHRSPFAIQFFILVNKSLLQRFLLPMKDFSPADLHYDHYLSIYIPPSPFQQGSDHGS